MAESPYVRAKEKDTGHKVTILRAQLTEAYQELKQPAVDEHGAPLAPEYATKSPSNQSGQKANTDKENS